MEVRLVAAAALLLLGITACEGGEDGNRVIASPSPSSAVVEGQPCPPAPAELRLPAHAGCVTSVTGTFEAGRGGQTLIVYALTDERKLPSEWHLRVTREPGNPLDQRVAIGSRASYPVVIGAEDADGRGLDEAFVKLVTHSYHSGKTNELGIFGVQDGRFVRVRADGEPLLFQVGGVSVFGQGAECRDVDADGRPEFLLLHIDGVTNYVQSWVERVYRWRQRSLRLVDRREGRLVKTGYSDPLLWRYYSFRCLTLDPGGAYSRG